MPRKKSSKPSPNLKQNKAKIELNQKMAEKAAKADMPKTPVQDKWSAAAKRGSQKRLAARAKVDAKRKALTSPRPTSMAPEVKAPAKSGGRAMSPQAPRMRAALPPGEKVVGSGSGPASTKDYTVKSTTNAVKSGGIKGIAKAVGRAVPYVGAAITGYEVGKAMTEKSGISGGGGQMKRGRKPTMADQARSMARQSFNETKGSSKAAIAATTAKAGGAKSVTKPASSGNAASAPKATSERPSSKGAEVVDKSQGTDYYAKSATKGKSKQMKRNAGYDNYMDIMSSHGLAEGGRVPGGYEMDVSPMGMVKNAIRAVRDIKKGMQKNAPKASSSNQQPVERKSPRKDGSSGRELVPQSIMDDVKTSRGYANGGQVGNKDIYGSYGGSGGMAEHMVKVEKTNIKRNG